MALSYLQEAQINAGLLASQQYDMKQESDKQSMSPPLNNNISLFPGLGAAAGLSMLTRQQLIAANHNVALVASLPVSLQASLAAVANPSLYSHALFGSWASSVASSPPPPPPPPLSLGSISPTLSTKSNSRSRTNHNNNNSVNNNNNNVVSSSADKMNKKGQSKRRGPKVKVESLPEGTAPPSPPTSVSPEVTKDVRSKVFTCQTCLRSFAYKHVLQNHERTHTGEKPFACNVCAKRFTRDHHLKTHMRLHTGEKPFQCKFCDRRFVQVANLRRHERVHTGDRPYGCSECAQKFSDSNQLKSHQLIHRNERPFQCEHCDVRFRRRHHLLNHRCSANRPNIASPSVTSDDLEEEIDIDDVDEDRKTMMRLTTLNQLQSPISMNAIGSLRMPINSTNHNSRPIAIPEQTEPEDLSMSTGMHRPSSHSHSSGDSALDRSPGSDTLQEVEDEELDVSLATPCSLFLRGHHEEYRNHLANLAKSGSNES